MTRFSFRLLAALAVAAFGVAVFAWWPAQDQELSPEKQNGERKILYWQAPMDPSYRSDRPGKSPMGMDLIPIYADEATADTIGGVPVVRIEPGIVQNLGIRTEKVLKADLSRNIHAVGYISYDESKVSNIHLRVDGWIEDLRIQSEGERVKKGELLFRLYSPTLVNAQGEFLQAVRTGDKRLIQSSRNRLQALNVSDDQIDAIATQGAIRQLVDFRAPQDGIVAKLNVVEGSFVQPGTNVATLADLSTVWVLTDVFEDQAPWTRTGLAAEARLPFLPGAPRLGRVEFVYPTLDADTRALRVRLKFDNPDEALKPNMFANVTIKAEPIRNALIVPRDAVIRSGNTERVIIAEGDGRFQAVQVLTGLESGDMIEILAGLKGGEKVVVSGQFLIDSEASLTGAIRRLTGSDAGGATDDQPVTGHGVLNQVKAEQGIVNISHAPIPQISWPDMTMDFEVDGDVDLSAFTAGDRITFELRRALDGTYKVVSIRREADHETTGGPAR